MFGWFLLSLLCLGGVSIKEHNEQKRREIRYKEHFGLGHNLKLEKQLGVEYYKEMEQMARDELKKNKPGDVVLDNILKKHFPQAINNREYLASHYDLRKYAVAKARLEVWRRGYLLTNTMCRTAEPPSDIILNRAGWYPYFIRDSGAQALKDIVHDKINEYPYSDELCKEYPTYELWLRRNLKRSKKQ